MLIRNLLFNATRSFSIIKFQHEALIVNNLINLCAYTNTCDFVTSKRFKYTQHLGVKGIRNRKHAIEARARMEALTDETEMAENNVQTLEGLNLEDREYDEVANTTMHVTRDFTTAQNVLIIQPYIKWGTKRNMETTPDDQLKEAEALIRSLPNWQVALTLKVPLDSLERKALFGTGKTQELKDLIQQLRQNSNQHPLTCLFISKATLSFAQKLTLESQFNLPIMDRYSVVIQILRLHATSAEARLQVAMAEIPYIWAQAKESNLSMATKRGYALSDSHREILKTRERKLRQELTRIRSHRKLLRKKRKLKDYPIVAVVGYTNAGKTSLIKALTDEQTMQPRDQLFATLDVTAHAGVLPCSLEIIYMDTVGFMSDLPTGLIECFIATLEDAMLADVIVHVQDISHVCHQAQKRHVEKTLEALAHNISIIDDEFNTKNDIKLPAIINVGNKSDLLTNIDNFVTPQDTHLVSSTKMIGFNGLIKEIEQKVLKVTNRRKLVIRVRNGGQEMAWLYKNAAVVSMRADEKNAEHLLITVVISEINMQHFKREFIQ